MNDETKPKNRREIEAIVDDSFSYEGYQIVRGEFFSHTYEPCITFNKNKIAVNSACIRKLPNVEYIQMLIDPEKKKIAILPSEENVRDSFRWRTANSSKALPRQISCRMFYDKVMTLMNWNSNFRYKLLGKLIESHGQLLFTFDLKSPETFVREVKSDGKERASRKPLYPEEWKDQFGLPFEEHKRAVQVDIFDGYVIYGTETVTKEVK